MSWHLVGSSVWMSLLATFTKSKTHNMAGFPPESEWAGIVPGPGLLLHVGGLLKTYKPGMLGI